jgi:hypothetical protein
MHRNIYHRTLQYIYYVHMYLLLYYIITVLLIIIIIIIIIKKYSFLSYANYKITVHNLHILMLNAEWDYCFSIMTDYIYSSLWQAKSMADINMSSFLMFISELSSVLITFPSFHWCCSKVCIFVFLTHFYKK